MTAVVADPRHVLADLPPVALDDLVAEAELLARVDRKYVVPREEAALLLADLPSGTRVLEIEGRRDFGYRSTYLDTPDRASYLSAGRSVRRRWKVRGRAYLDTGGTWLEVKTRAARGRTHKDRIACVEPGPHGLDATGSRFVADTLGFHGPVVASLRPSVVTTYRRATLLLPGSAARATVDVDLAWSSPDGVRRLERPGLCVVETKTGSSPSLLDRHLWRHGHRPVRISKYGVGLAALDPDLPRLKWHRVLEQHLDVPRPDRSARPARPDQPHRPTAHDPRRSRP